MNSNKQHVPDGKIYHVLQSDPLKINFLKVGISNHRVALELPGDKERKKVDLP